MSIITISHPFSKSSPRIVVIIITIIVVVIISGANVYAQDVEKLVAAEEYEMGRNLVIIYVNGQPADTSFINNDHHSPRLLIQIIFQNTTFDLDVSLNTGLLSSSYVETYVKNNKTFRMNSNQTETFCYYIGNVLHTNATSSVALSTCEGVKGFFSIDNETYHITPIHASNSSHEVLTYKISRDTGDNIAKWFCGVSDLNEKVKRSLSAEGIRSRFKREAVAGALEDQLIIELYVSNDVARYNYYNQDLSKVYKSTKEIVNAASLLYQTVGFYVVLVGTEVWTDVDQIPVDADSGKTLSSYQNYKLQTLMKRISHDDAFLISRKSFLSSVLGLAGVSTMCSAKTACGIMTAIGDNSGVSGAILAHELGHNLGLSHDSDSCYCESTDVTCVMYYQASTQKASRFFSSCSKDQLSNSISKKGYDICLKNMPTTVFQDTPVCGNGIVENGESCDCGRVQSQLCNSACCNVTTCALIGAAQCASGACCDIGTCKLKALGNSCRNPVDSTCDLPEYCDGTSAFCPADVFTHDGTQCTTSGMDGYCHKGKCKNRQSQCRLIYGPSATVSDDTCYTRNNVRGDINGFCSTTYGSDTNQMGYTACSASDAMCGALNCEAPSSELAFYQQFIYKTSKPNSKGSCLGVIFDYGNQVESPGMVPTGSPCGTNKICSSQRCVDVSVVLNDRACPTCVYGICNSNGNCHCNSGYGGSKCDVAVAGGGGSTDSGPMGVPAHANNVGLIVGLIIFFILVILIILLCVYDYKHKKYFLNGVSALSSKMTSSGPVHPTSSPRAGDNKFANRSRPTIEHNVEKGHENIAYVSDQSIIPTRQATARPQKPPPPRFPEPDSMEYTNYQELVKNDNNNNFSQLNAGQLINANATTPLSSYPPSYTPFASPPLPTNKPQWHMPPVPSSKLKPVQPNNVPSRPAPVKPNNSPTKPANLPTKPANLPTKPTNLPTKPANLPNKRPDMLPVKSMNTPVRPSDVPVPMKRYQEPTSGPIAMPKLPPASAKPKGKLDANNNNNNNREPANVRDLKSRFENSNA